MVEVWTDLIENNWVWARQLASLSLSRVRRRVLAGLLPSIVCRRVLAALSPSRVCRRVRGIQERLVGVKCQTILHWINQTLYLREDKFKLNSLKYKRYIYLHWINSTLYLRKDKFKLDSLKYKRYIYLSFNKPDSLSRKR